MNTSLQLVSETPDNQVLIIDSFGVSAAFGLPFPEANKFIKDVIKRVSKDFASKHFLKTTVPNKKGQLVRGYKVSRNGFMMLGMCTPAKCSPEIKMLIIERMNSMCSLLGDYSPIDNILTANGFT